MDDQRDSSAVALRRELSGLLWPLDEPTHDRLLTAVCTYVDDAKQAGWGPERVLVAVKRIAHDAGSRPSARVVLTTPLDQTLTAKDELLIALVGWCIEKYYDRPRDESAPLIEAHRPNLTR